MRHYKKAGEPLNETEKAYIRANIERLSITRIHQNLRRGRALIRQYLKEEGIVDNRAEAGRREGLFNVYEQKNWIA